MTKGNGIERKGKTDGKHFGNDGPKVSIEKGKKGPGGKTNESMLALGRNLAKLKANGK